MAEPPVGTIALLFTDIESSTRLAREAGDGWANVLAEHHRLLREAIEAHGGYVDATEGDAFFATFADAKAGVEAAVTAQRALSRAAWPHGVGELRVRMGVHTGFVERNALGYVSIEVHRAARVGAAAAGGQILVTSTTRALLGDESEIEDLGEHRLKDFPSPERLFNVVYDGRRAAEFGPPRTAEARPTNLPEELAPLVGRDSELDHLSLLLGDGTRFVTLVGAGGAGKTRLALTVGRRLLDDLPGGAFVVPLAPVTVPEGVLPAVARALDLADDEGDLLPRIAARLGERRSLLVLDNFEQILAAGPAVAELVERSRALRVLVTSQAPLHVRGETVVALEALEPDAAAMLFSERARAAVPGWSPRPGDERAIAGVCDRVGRLPLAIELAAARVAVLAPDDLLARLEASSDVLRNPARDAPERHRSLRATFEWTYALLEPEHQVLFARMGVFTGPVPLDAVEAVGGAAALDGLEALVDFSLVRRVESPAYGWRFTMPQALRDFARETLAASGEEAEARRRHAEHVLEVARESRIWFAVSEERQRRLLAIDAELRPALAWAEADDAELYRELVAGLGLTLMRRGFVREVIAYAERADPRLDATGVWIANSHAYSLLMAGRLDEAEARLEPAIAVARERKDAVALGLLLHTLCWIADTLHQERALAIGRESLELLRGDPRLEERAAIAYIQALINIGRIAEAEDAIGELLPVLDRRTKATWWGDIALATGRPADALPHYAMSMEMALRDNDGIQVINDATGIAVALLRAGEMEAGLEAAGASIAVIEDAGHGGFGIFTQGLAYGTTLEAARAAAGPKEMAAFDRGRRLGPVERVPRILALARSVDSLTNRE
jgi:predicted ATPase/class 3 adenylate cyclase